MVDKTDSLAVTWDSVPADVGVSPWAFPPRGEWPDDDLVGAGADLAPATLIAAYRAGLFPMGVSDESAPGGAGTRRRARRVLGWWSPNPRGILPLDGLKVSDSLRRSRRKFSVRVDSCFTQVIEACAAGERRGAWIDDDIIDAYVRLHRLGWAHSIEVFDAHGVLAGGLYGVRIGGLFAGESMFHRATDASKVALVALVEHMQQSHMSLLDVQWRTDHLATLGAKAISRDDYLERLAAAVGGDRLRRER